MAQSTSPTTAGSAARLGLIFGIILGLLSLPTIALVTLSGGLGLGVNGILLIFLVIAFVLLFVAGLLAARRVGQLGAGAVAGLVGGAVAGLIAVCLGTVIILLLAPYADLAALRAARAASGAVIRTRRLGPIVALIRLTLGGVILAMVGLIAGTLGGLLGRIGRATPRSGQTPPAYTPIVAQYATTSAPQTAQPNQGYQTPFPQRGAPQVGDQPDYAISYPNPSGYAEPGSVMEPYRGDDPTTHMPFPHLPTPIPDSPTPTAPPSAY